MPPRSSTACCRPRSVATPDIPARPRRRRRWLFALLALALLGGAGALVLWHYMQPARLTALLVQQAQARLGVELALEGDADFGFLPRLHLHLPKPRLRAGDGILLAADTIDVRVPWSSLNGQRIEIEHLDIVRPRVELDALSRWLAGRPPSDAATPDLRFALTLRDGTLLADGKPVAEGIHLQFTNTDDLAVWFARLARTSTSVLPPAVGTGSIDRLQIGTTRIEGLKLDLRDGDGTPKP